MNVQIVEWPADRIFLVVICNGAEMRRVFQPSMADALDYVRRYMAGQA